MGCLKRMLIAVSSNATASNNAIITCDATKLLATVRFSNPSHVPTAINLRVALAMMSTMPEPETKVAVRYHFEPGVRYLVKGDSRSLISSHSSLRFDLRERHLRHEILLQHVWYNRAATVGCDILKTRDQKLRVHPFVISHFD